MVDSLSTQADQEYKELVRKILKRKPFQFYTEKLGIDFERNSATLRTSLAFFLKYPPTLEQMMSLVLVKDVKTTKTFLNSILNEEGR